MILSCLLFLLFRKKYSLCIYLLLTCSHIHVFYQRVLLQRQRDKYEEEEEKMRAESPMKAQQGRPVLDRWKNQGGANQHQSQPQHHSQPHQSQHSYGRNDWSGDTKEQVEVEEKPRHPYSLSSSRLPPPSSYSIRERENVTMDDDDLNTSTVNTL